MKIVNNYSGWIAMNQSTINHIGEIMKIKAIILVVLCCMLSMGGMVFAQNAPIDFETQGYGASWTWTVFENGTNPALEIIANPVSGGINTSATVAKFTALVTNSNPWAGCESQHGTDIGTFTLDVSNSTVKIMIYKTVVSDVGIKLVKPDGWSLGEIKVANTVTDAWEELTFDLSSLNQEGYDQIVIFPDFATRTSDNIIYFDNITFSEGIVLPTEPEAAATTPTVPEADVISLFSGAYTDVTVDTWSATWDNADVADAQVFGDDVKLYTNFGYAGIEFTSQVIDATAMTHFHMDIWTPDAIGSGAFHVKLVDAGADGLVGGGNVADDTESLVSFNANTDPALVAGEWVGIDVPLANFTGLASTSHLAQLIIEGDPSTLYVDNVYFYSNSVGVVDDEVVPTTFTLGQNYPNPFNPITTIQYELSQRSDVQIIIHDLLGRKVTTLVSETQDAGYQSVTWDATDQYGKHVSAGMYFYAIEAGKYSAIRKMVLLK